MKPSWVLASKLECRNVKNLLKMRASKRRGRGRGLWGGGGGGNNIATKNGLKPVQGKLNEITLIQ